MSITMLDASIPGRHKPPKSLALIVAERQWNDLQNMFSMRSMEVGYIKNAGVDDDDTYDPKGYQYYDTFDITDYQLEVGDVEASQVPDDVYIERFLYKNEHGNEVELSDIDMRDVYDHSWDHLDSDFLTPADVARLRGKDTRIDFLCRKWCYWVKRTLDKIRRCSDKTVLYALNTTLAELDEWLYNATGIDANALDEPNVEAAFIAAEARVGKPRPVPVTVPPYFRVHRRNMAILTQDGIKAMAETLVEFVTLLERGWRHVYMPSWAAAGLMEIKNGFSPG